MPRLLKFTLFLIFGAFLGLFYLWYRAEPQRVSLESGVLWTAQEIISPTPTPASSTATLLFGGDMMFDRHVRLTAKDLGYVNLFSDELKQLFAEHDLVIANLEGPITDNPSKSLNTTPGGPNNTVFTFDPEVAQILKQVNIQLVNLGNNHIFDFGLAGANSTLEYLTQAEVGYFGWLGNRSDALKFNKISLITQVKDFTLGFVNYNQFGDQVFNEVLQEIIDLRPQVEYLIVYTHWGIEYAPEANEVIKQQGHQLIEAGADLVIGTHPHVIQPYEDYLHGRIYYSLGNFVFDQYFSPEVTRGQLVQVELERVSVEATPSASFKEFEVLMQSLQPIELVQSEEILKD